MSRTLKNKKEKKENSCKSLSDKDLGVRRQPRRPKSLGRKGLRQLTVRVKIIPFLSLIRLTIVIFVVIVLTVNTSRIVNRTRAWFAGLSAVFANPKKMSICHLLNPFSWVKDTVCNRHTDENQTTKINKTSNHFLTPYVSIIHYRQRMSITLQNKRGIFIKILREKIYTQKSRGGSYKVKLIHTNSIT